MHAVRFTLIIPQKTSDSEPSFLFLMCLKLLPQMIQTLFPRLFLKCFKKDAHYNDENTPSLNFM